MKKTLFEEVNQIHKMMGLNEQPWLDKLKNTAQNVGNKIHTGVNQVAQKVINSTQQPQQSIQPVENTLEQIRTEWSKINTDMSNMKGFGEGISKDENITGNMAQLNARIAILKKMGKTNGTISASVIDEKLFKDVDGTFHRFVIMEPNN